jgi:addiction module HigA family antidote
MPADIPMPHPGVVLREEFLEPMGLTVYALAKAIHVTRSRVNDICHGRQGITAAVALRLGRFFWRRPPLVHEHAIEIRPARAGRTAGGGTGGHRAAQRGVRGAALSRRSDRIED